MKKHLLFIGIMTFFAIVFVGCSTQTGNSDKPQEETQVVEAGSPVMTSKESEAIELTLDELSKFDGKNGNPSYVAVDGIIYDVSEIAQWKDGEHQGRVTAGKDLSKEIESSPHGKSMLEKAKKIGTLKE